MKRAQTPGILGTYLKQLLLLIVVVAAWALFSPLLSRSGTEVDLDFLDDRMRIMVSGGEASYTREIGYAEIRSVETAYSLELGEMVTGEQSRKLWCGIWKNDAFGEYFLDINPMVDVYCVITAENGVYVLNIQTKADTESFADALRNLLQGRSSPM